MVAWGSKFGTRKWKDYDKMNAARRAKKLARLAVGRCLICRQVGHVDDKTVTCCVDCGCMEVKA